jgi:membrane protein implicated in regulation of membrane protease activity
VSGGQIAALIFAILLLLPGGCFLFFGIILTPGTAVADPRLLLLPVAAAILALAGLLFWVAFRRPRPGPGDTPGDMRS